MLLFLPYTIAAPYFTVNVLTRADPALVNGGSIGAPGAEGWNLGRECPPPYRESGLIPKCHNATQ